MIAISTSALHGWLFIFLLFCLFTLCILWFIRRSSTWGKCAIKIFLTTTFMALLFNFIYIIDLIGTGRYYSRFYSKKTMQKAIAERLIKYKKEHGEFPINFEELIKEGPVLMLKNKYVPLQYFDYKQPQAQDGQIIMLWDTNPTAINHFWIPWHDKVIRNVTFSNGAIETINENKFKLLYKNTDSLAF